MLLTVTCPCTTPLVRSNVLIMYAGSPQKYIWPKSRLTQQLSASAKRTGATDQKLGGAGRGAESNEREGEVEE